MLVLVLVLALLLVLVLALLLVLVLVLMLAMELAPGGQRWLASTRLKPDHSKRVLQQEPANTIRRTP